MRRERRREGGTDDVGNRQHDDAPADPVGTGRATFRRGGAEAALSKVPEVTAWFWIVKILTTGMGRPRPTSWRGRWDRFRRAVWGSRA
ncbi:hypothetical protein ACFSNO_05695 [Streptomyces cirratus]